MYARVTTVAVRPDKVNDVVTIFQGSIVPDVTAAQGCKGISLLVDPTTGNGLSITYWDTAANAQAYESSGGYQQQVAKVAQYFAGPPTVATYEVPVRS
jgi:heme-degrading monooxygenase HmoA